MNAGMSAENFTQLAAAVGRLGHEPSEEPVAVVRCAEGWRTLFADGSSHPGRPCHRGMMAELAEMVDGFRADEDELRRLAVLWQAIEDEVGEEVAAGLEERHEAVAAENRAAAAAAERIIDVDALEDEIDAELDDLVAGLRREAADRPRLELRWPAEGVSGAPVSPGGAAQGGWAQDAASQGAAPKGAAPKGAAPKDAASAGTERTSTAPAPVPQNSAAPLGGEQEWHSTSTFVPWSVVETMIDVELDGYFRRAS